MNSTSVQSQQRSKALTKMLAPVLCFLVNHLDKTAIAQNIFTFLTTLCQQCVSGTFQNFLLLRRQVVEDSIFNIHAKYFSTNIYVPKSGAFSCQGANIKLGHKNEKTERQKKDTLHRSQKASRQTPKNHALVTE